MELSDEQYNQVLRYTDGEMSPTESKAFEAVLIQNSAISNEVEFYKEIRSHIESIDKKIENTNTDTSEKKGTDEVLRMIKQARVNWENSHKNNEGQEHGTLLKEVKNQGQSHYDEIEQEYHNLIEINDEPESANKKGYFKRPLQEKAKVKRIHLSPWLAAAVVIGFVCTSVTFLYFQNENGHQEITNNKNKPGLKVTVENENLQSRKKNNIPDKTSSQANSSAFNNASDNPTISKRVSERNLKKEKLFAQYFEPDDLPSQIPAPLEDASAFYKNRKTEKAITEYKNLLVDIEDAKSSNFETRGEDSEIELIDFFAHYYLAQTYMLADNVRSAAKELRIALAKAPDRTWKNKVRWYMALASLKTGQIQKAETLLKEVGGNKYKQKAITLGNELKRD